MPGEWIDAAANPAEIAREIVAWVSEVFRSIAVLDWILFGVAALIVYWIVATLLAETSVGHVEVDLLESDASGNPAVHELTALLRERVATSGLPAPPLVPVGSPKSKWVAVLEASPVPQGNMIAKLLEALPIPGPLQYKLSGTLFSRPVLPLHGISLWLRPSSRGNHLMEELASTSDRRAVELAAFHVYAHISEDVAMAFPSWARWNTLAALEQYRLGCRAAGDGKTQDASRHLNEAVRMEPGNALARLQLANVYEQHEKRDALLSYLDISRKWSHLVQARYRTSVLASALAHELEDTAETDMAKTLRRLAIRESTATLQLLKPWYTLICLRRLRCQFEPTARERRQLKRAIGISRQCQRVRSLGDREDWRARLVVVCSQMLVDGRHLAFGLTRLDSETHLVATCFKALLLRRAKQLRANKAKQQVGAPAALPAEATV